MGNVDFSIPWILIFCFENVPQAYFFIYSVCAKFLIFDLLTEFQYKLYAKKHLSLFSEQCFSKIFLST